MTQKLFLTIETSCDETAVAILKQRNGAIDVIAHKIWSQIDQHALYGGVVPEIAARSHLKSLYKLIEETLASAQLQIDDIDVFAATNGPGLIGGLIIGVMAAKTFACIHNKPFIAVNHLVGHAVIARASNLVQYPYLLLLASGGHTQIMHMLSVSEYEIIGSAIDDALGETFDKLAKMLGLPYPGGPIIEKFAKNGNIHRFKLPSPLITQDNCDFSFSGLKTALSNLIKQYAPNEITNEFISDLSASFQFTICNVLKNRIKRAIAITECKRSEHAGGDELQHKNFVLSGGVASNKYIRSELEAFLLQFGYKFTAPPIELCTDNAVMIGYAAIEMFEQGIISDMYCEPYSRAE